MRWSLSIAAAIIAVGAALIYSGSPQSRDVLDYNSVPPWFIFNGVAWLCTALQDIIDSLKPPAIQGLELSFSINRLIAVYACSKAGWPELLESGEKTGAELAAHANMSKKMARRLLRTCVASKVFREVSTIPGVDDNDRKYINRPLGDILRRDHPYSVKAYLGYQVEDFSPGALKLWGAVTDDAAIPYSAAHNLPNANNAVWLHYERDPVQGEQFNRAMTSIDSLVIAPILLDFPWADKCSAIIDVGGGRGSLLASLLRVAPDASGVLFDQESVVDQAKSFWSEKFHDRLHRVAFRPGSFFDADSIPKLTDTHGTNCYVSKFILHDWNDEHAQQIVRNVGQALRPGDRMVIVDSVLSEYETDLTRVMLDIEMRVYGGQERSEAELGAMLGAAGLKVVKTYPTRSPICVLEAIRPQVS